MMMHGGKHIGRYMICMVPTHREVYDVAWCQHIGTYMVLHGAN